MGNRSSPRHSRRLQGFTTMTPSIKEALDSLLAFRHGDTKHLTSEHARILFDALATLSPPAGERREAIHNLVRKTAMSLPPSDFGSHRAIEAMTEAILASGLVQDE